MGGAKGVHSRIVPAATKAYFPPHRIAAARRCFTRLAPAILAQRRIRAVMELARCQKRPSPRNLLNTKLLVNRSSGKGGETFSPGLGIEVLGTLDKTRTPCKIEDELRTPPSVPKRVL